MKNRPRRELIFGSGSDSLSYPSQKAAITQTSTAAPPGLVVEVVKCPYEKRQAQQNNNNRSNFPPWHTPQHSTRGRLEKRELGPPSLDESANAERHPPFTYLQLQSWALVPTRREGNVRETLAAPSLLILLCTRGETGRKRESGKWQVLLLHTHPAFGHNGLEQRLWIPT